MVRKTFFSFHYKRDAWRAGQVRNSNLLAKEDRYGFIDSVDWEKIEKQGEDAIKRWIDEQLNNTSVTVVLIGTETSERDWVDYEIRQSWERGNALLGVYIHNVKGQDQKTDMLGANPFDHIKFTDGTILASICKTYDWVNDNGRDNLGLWIEEAFQTRSKYKDKKLSEQKNNEKTNDSSSNRNSATSGGFIPKQPWGY
jgi:hypothetical protein